MNRKEYNKNYYKKNKKKIIEKNKEYYKRNKIKVSIYKKEYGQLNKEQLYKKAKIRNKKNKIHIANRMKKWRIENKEYIRGYFIKKKYGISYDEYKDLIDKNSGLCPICKNILIFDVGVRNQHAAVVDHNHLTGKVRNIICSNCNLGMGKFKDDIEIIRSVVNYLEENN